GSIDGENIRGSDRGGEGPASGVSVGSRAAKTSSVITKVPGASRSAHTTRGSGGEGEALSNYRVRRTGANSYCQFGADSYGHAICCGHAQIVCCSHCRDVVRGISIDVRDRASGGGWRAVAEVPVARDWGYAA